MAAQGLWSGTISFSLVAIPVRLVKAVEPGRISFHLLHSTDYSRLSRTLYCPKEGTTVPLDEVVRGYEIAPDKFIVMTDEELESVSPERSSTIEISGFVDLREIDPIYFDHPYYLAPAKGGEKAYHLLAEALRKTNKAGLAKFVMAEREHLSLISGKNGVLVLTTLHYGEEILSADGLVPAGARAAAKEEKAVMRDIERMLTDFDPGKYADQRRKKIVALLDAKAKDTTAVISPAAEEVSEGPPDLVAALEESMRALKGST